MSAFSLSTDKLQISESPACLPSPARLWDNLADFVSSDYGFGVWDDIMNMFHILCDVKL